MFLQDDWIILDELLPNCFPSVVAPIRFKYSDNGKLIKNEYETLVDNKWIDYNWNDTM